jgi:hypothetical protein
MATIDQDAVAARIEYLANVLFLDDSEMPDVSDHEDIILWAVRHGQSVDWIYRGDIKSLVLMLANCSCGNR